MVKTVTNILKLSPTHFVSNIRHQHRCSQYLAILINPLVDITVIIKILRCNLWNSEIRGRLAKFYWLSFDAFPIFCTPEFGSGTRASWYNMNHTVFAINCWCGRFMFPPVFTGLTPDDQKIIKKIFWRNQQFFLFQRKQAFREGYFLHHNNLYIQIWKEKHAFSAVIEIVSVSFFQWPGCDEYLDDSFRKVSHSKMLQRVH